MNIFNFFKRKKKDDNIKNRNIMDKQEVKSLLLSLQDINKTVNESTDEEEKKFLRSKRVDIYSRIQKLNNRIQH